MFYENIVIEVFSTVVAFLLDLGFQYLVIWPENHYHDMKNSNSLLILAIIIHIFISSW